MVSNAHRTASEQRTKVNCALLTMTACYALLLREGKMKLINLKKVSNYKVEKWLENNIKELTPYQKEWIRNEEMVRFAPFEFYERRKKVDNVFVRLSVIFIPIAWILLVIGLPFNFFATGTWGYNKLEWFSKWSSACGL